MVIYLITYIAYYTFLLACINMQMPKMAFKIYDYFILSIKVALVLKILYHFVNDL